MSKTAQRKVAAYSQGRDDARTNKPFRFMKAHPLHREYTRGFKGQPITGIKVGGLK